MKKIYFCSVILILLALQSCSFKPDGEEFVKLDPTIKQPDIEINLNLVTDTIYIHQDQSITFAYAPMGNQIVWAKFIIDGQESDLQKDQLGNIRFTKGFKTFPGGIYPFELKIFARSQTGSIADRLNAEGSLISRKWILVVRDYSELKSRFTKVDFVDGSLKIEWDKFVGKDFKNYKLYKKISTGSGEVNKLVATITSRDQTSVMDNTYHGESSAYYILTNDEFKSNSYYVSGPFPTVTVTNNTNGDIQLSWAKPPYYNNLKGYRISYNDENFVIQHVGVFNDTGINSFTIPNPIFGTTYSLYLTMMPLTDNLFTDREMLTGLSARFDASYGISTPSYTVAHGGMAPVSYFYDTYSQDGIVVYDHQKLKIVRKIKYPDILSTFDISANNKYLEGITYWFKGIYLEDLNDSTKSKKIDLSATFPQMSHIGSISDMGTGILIIKNKTTVLFDYIHESKLAEIDLSNYGLFTTKITSSGKFFFCQTDIGYEYFQFKNNQIIRLEKADNQYNDKVLHVDYLSGTNDKLIRAFTNRIEVIDCNTWTIEKQWSFPNLISDVYNLDKKSGKLLIRLKNKLNLFDVMSGTKEEIATTTESSSLQYSYLFYNNGMTFWKIGRALK